MVEEPNDSDGRPGSGEQRGRGDVAAPGWGAEGANGTTTPNVDEILRSNGVISLPDILANAGGVTVSYFEWVQGQLSFFWNKKQVDDKLQEIMEKSFDEVHTKATDTKTDYRNDAYTLAIGKVAEAHRLKGLFP